MIHTYVWASGGKKCWFFGKYCVRTKLIPYCVFQYCALIAREDWKTLQQTFTCSNSTIKTLENNVKYVQNQQERPQNDANFRHFQIFL